MKPIDLQIEQEVVDQIIIDYQVSLKLSDGSYFMFECKFTLTKPDGTAFEITPGDSAEQLVHILELHNASLARGLVVGGTLRLEFSNGTVLECPPDDQYEAWSLFSPSGNLQRIISTPGGDLSIWRQPGK